jgi:hypothetical protein
MKTSLLIAATMGALLPLTLAQTEVTKDDPAPKTPPIQQLSETEFQLGDIKFNKTSRRIEFPGRINTREDLLEYVLVHSNGKTHESLLATDINPFQLNIVMLLCGYAPDTNDLFDDPDNPPTKKPTNNPAPSQVQLSLTWTLDGQDSVTTTPEDLILNRFNGKPMTPGPGQYNGSTIEDGRFQAELEGSIIAIYLDQWAMFNFPRSGNDDDQRWLPITKKLPPKDTPVTIVIEPASPDPNQPE